MLLNGKTFHLKRIVASALSKSSEIAAFAGTCGQEVEVYSKKLMRDGHSIEGLIADLVGSEIAETIAGFIHTRIEEAMAEKGINITNRYSPGYCQWNVSDQQQLFALLDKNNCGIYLTDSSLMIPLKSVSGIIGIGKEVRNQGYTCSKCDADYCLYRDKKNSDH